jgi:hypothetical protein
VRSPTRFDVSPDMCGRRQLSIGAPCSFWSCRCRYGNPGCTDSAYAAYSASANVDDGSCALPHPHVLHLLPPLDLTVSDPLPPDGLT